MVFVERKLITDKVDIEKLTKHGWHNLSRAQIEFKNHIINNFLTLKFI